MKNREKNETNVINNMIFACKFVQVNFCMFKTKKTFCNLFIYMIYLFDKLHI